MTTAAAAGGWGEDGESREMLLDLVVKVRRGKMGGPTCGGRGPGGAPADRTTSGRRWAWSGSSSEWNLMCLPSESESSSNWKWMCPSSGAMRTCLATGGAAEDEDAIAGGGEAAGRPSPLRCCGRRSSGSGGAGGSDWTPRRKSCSTAPTARSDSA